jgi:hypothetical protein
MFLGLYYGTWFIIGGMGWYLGAAFFFWYGSHPTQAGLWMSYAMANIFLAMLAQGFK